MRGRRLVFLSFATLIIIVILMVVAAVIAGRL